MAQKKIRQYGNFVLCHDSKAGFVSVRAVSGFWQIRYRNDHPMFGALLRFSSDRTMDVYLEHFFNLVYVLTQGFPDGECLEGVLDAVGSWYSRLSVPEKEVSVEEDDRILGEVVMSEQMREEIIKDGEGD